jgi:hypothetical protein
MQKPMASRHRAFNKPRPKTRKTETTRTWKGRKLYRGYYKVSNDFLPKDIATLK